VIAEPLPEGGLLGARLAHVDELCASDGRYLWLNEYANPANPMTHYRVTAPAIARQFPDLDVLFVGAGTCGTLMGCARYMKERRRNVRVVAVDTVGSVIFGGQPGRRMIPGLGAAVSLPRLDQSYIDDFVMVAEPETITTCRRLAARGFLTTTPATSPLWQSPPTSGSVTSRRSTPTSGWGSTTTMPCLHPTSRRCQRSCRPARSGPAPPASGQTDRATRLKRLCFFIAQ